MVHPDTDKEGRHDIDIPFEIWGKDNPLPLTEMQNFTKNTTLGLFQKFPERDFLFLGVEFCIYSVFCLSCNYPVFVSDAHLLYRPSSFGRSGPLY